jgi:hypothetical protein
VVWGTDYYDEWNYQDGVAAFNNCYAVSVNEILSRSASFLDNLTPGHVVTLQGNSTGLSAGTYLLSFYGELAETSGDSANPQLFRIRHEANGASDVIYKNVGSPVANHPDGNAPFSFQMYVTTTTGSIRIVRNCSTAKIRGYTIQRIR